jgi:hypothetical protein
MPTGERAKESSFRLWTEGKYAAEIHAQICGDSAPLRISVQQWIIEWERGRQAKWNPEPSPWETERLRVER